MIKVDVQNSSNTPHFCLVSILDR